ncbi:MAG: hypothetical protein ACREO5_00100 [Candidatus Binatia bacterium]
MAAPNPLQTLFSQIGNSVTQIDGKPLNTQYAGDLWRMQAMGPMDNPDLATVKDADGNPIGLVKDLQPDLYKTMKADYTEQQYDEDQGLLTGHAATSGDSNMDAYFSGGDRLPAIFRTEHNLNVGATMKDSGGDASYYNWLNATGGATSADHTVSGKLKNPNLVENDPTFGKLTLAANVDQKDPFWDTFWQIAPMIPMMIATFASGGALTPLMKFAMDIPKDIMTVTDIMDSKHDRSIKTDPSTWFKDKTAPGPGSTNTATDATTSGTGTMDADMTQLLTLIAQATGKGG